MAAGIYFDRADYRITKRGRTWFQATTRSGRSCRIRITEETAYFQPGEAYTIFAKVEDIDFELRDREQRIRRMDVTALPAGYVLNKAERRAMLKWCIAALEEGIITGYVHQGAVRRGVRVGGADFPALYAEFESLILKANRTAATVEANQSIYALEQAGSDHEREEARRVFVLALAEVERHAAGMALWLRARYESINRAIIDRKGEQLTLFAA